MLRNKAFWAGLVVGYLLLVFMPQLNIRSMASKPKS